MELVTPQTMGEMDRQTIADIGVPGPVLMDRAARGAVDALIDRFAPERGAAIGILCGTGNNGGDGLAMATLLANRGFAPQVIVLGAPDQLSEDAGLYYKIATNTGIAVATAATEEVLEERLNAVGDCSIWCDALLGTGLDRPLGGRYAGAVQFLNQQPAPVLAIDIPTGLDGRTGQILGDATNAEQTVTFGFAKLGHCLDPGRTCCGALCIVDIGIPAAVVNRIGIDAIGLDRPWLIANLPIRPQQMHKGRAGKTIHIGGRPDTAGAIAMSAQAALVGGAGLITIATDRAVQPGVFQRMPEVMTRPVMDSAADTTDCETLKQGLAAADIAVFGPGIGVDDGSAKLFETTLKADLQALIVDADGLNLLARRPKLREYLARFVDTTPVILTPHPGEASRLLDCTIDDVVADSMAAAEALCDALGATIVLKTAATVVAGPQNQWAINRTGNPGMATGGMGDALTGLIAAACAEWPDTPFKAACQAVVVHGLAGDLSAADTGHRGLTVSSLLDAVPRVWQSVER